MLLKEEIEKFPYLSYWLYSIKKTSKLVEHKLIGALYKLRNIDL